MKKILSATFLILIACSACRREDIKTVDYPFAPKNKQEEMAMIEKIEKLDSTGKITARFENGRIYIKYDSMALAKKNIEYTLGIYPYETNH